MSKFPRYQAVLEKARRLEQRLCYVDSAPRRNLAFPGEDGNEWSNLADELQTDPDVNPFALRRAAFDDVEQRVKHLKKQVEILEEKAAVDPAYDRRLERAKEEYERWDEQLTRLLPDAVINVRYDPHDPAVQIRCRVEGCIEEIRDARESDRTGRRCPEHFAIATGRIPAKHLPESEVEQVVNNIMYLLGKD